MRGSVISPCAAGAGRTTLGSLFRERARLQPEAIAVEAGSRKITYRALNERLNRAAAVLRGLGVLRGDRVAILSENRPEYFELQLACAKIGAILACQNWRLAPPEVRHCIGLVEPRVTVVSERHAALLSESGAPAGSTVRFGDDYEARLASATAEEPQLEAEPEDGVLILYTSGTTGLPKGAVISQRAELARAMVAGAELLIPPASTTIVWAPLYHMAAAEVALSTFLGGGKVIAVDGLRPEEIVSHVARERLGYLCLMPGMIQPVIDELEKRRARPAGVQLCGAMADLVPAHQVARITELLSAPYLNSFASTETGLPPASGNTLPAGQTPARLSKRQNVFCEVRLLDPEDRDVPDGVPGELAMRGPTLFSGYWNAPEANERDFRGGWFHMGDVFVRNRDGTLDFVDRVKYMIKSGGENIYPAEIERVLLGDARVADAVVIRRSDPRWGEVPVAVVARKDEGLAAEALIARCRAELGGFKCPKEILFVPLEKLPRSTTGKIQRHQVEALLRSLRAG